MENNQRKLNNKGFSLIELIVVIAIMAVLVGVMAPNVMKYIESANQSTDLQNAAAIRSAVEVGVVEGDITGDVTVTINDAKTQMTVSGDGVDAALANVGISDTTNLKSKGWAEGVIGKYKIADFKWDNTVTANTNSKKPSEDITSAFK